MQGIERNLPVGSSRALSRNRCGDELWSAELFDPGGDCERVQMLEVFIAAGSMADLGASEDIERARLQSRSRAWR